MAERKRGPVKPPVLDMKAGSADSEAGAKPGADKTAETKRSSAKPLMPIGPWAAAAIGAGGGTVIGVGLVLVLAFTGILPGTGGIDDDLQARMIAAEESVTESLVGLRALNDRFIALQSTADRIGGLENELEGFGEEVAALSDRLAALEDAPAPGPVDLSSVEEQIGQLSNRLEAIASGASSEDADALAGALSETQSQLAALDEQVSVLTGDLETRETTLGSALAEIAALRAQMAAVPEPTALGSQDLLRLPLLLSSYEAAVEAGRPFAGELTALGSILPEVSVPANLSEAAETGLLRGDQVSASFSALVPDIMAAQPANPDAEWQEAALERLRALLAIRPAGEVEGNTPEAIVARIEAALGRRDFTAAAALLEALPDPMRQVAGETGNDIAALATAEAFAADLRAAALSLAAEAGN